MEDSHSSDRTAPTEGELDDELSDYLVINQSGEDSFGTLFRARHNKLHRLVSIRVLAVRREDFSGGLAEFSSRMARVAQLRHPHLAEISDFGETASGYLYIVSNPGEVAFEPGAVAERLGIAAAFKQILETLLWLHGQEITHGAIHPGVLSIDPTAGVKVDGLGISGMAGFYGRRFDPTRMFPYLAPEHSHAFGSSIPGDVYSVGVCLYWILTDKLPQGFFELPSNFCPQVGRSFDDPIVGSLQANPGERISVQTFTSLLSKPDQPQLSGASASLQVRSRRPSQPVVPARTKPLTSVPKESSAKEPPQAKGGSVPWVFLTVATLSLALVGFLIAYVFRKDEDAVKLVHGEQVASTSDGTSGSSPDPIEPEGLDQEHLAKLSMLLMEMQSLYLHCPNLQAVVERNPDLMSLLEVASGLDSIIIGNDNPDLVNFVMSKELMDEVSRIRDSARLSRPPRLARVGTLVGWTSSAGSQAGIEEFLPSFDGAAEGIVAVAGEIEAGIALTQDGAVASWGAETKPPSAASGLLRIDCESSNCIALSVDGSAVVWGGARIQQDAVANWKSLVDISAGRSHVLGVSEDFQVYAAGSNEAGQTSIPKELKNLKVFAVEAIGDFSYAVGVDGQYIRWGGGSPVKRDAVFLAEEAHSAGSDFYVRSRKGEVFRINKFGDKARVDLGSESVDAFLPRSSPEGNLLAYNLGTSRWNVKMEPGTSIDEAYFQEVSRGGIDMILGKDQFIGIVPRAISRPKESNSEKIEPVPMTSVEGIPVPEASAFREWTVAAGQSRRARLVESRDGTQFVLEFPDRTTTTVDGTSFSSEDREIASRWRPGTQIQKDRIREYLSSIPSESLLKDSGYIRMPMEVKDGNPIIPVTVDGREGVLVADTGATTTLITAALADAAGIVLSDGPYSLTWQGRLKTFKGKAQIFEIGGKVLLNDVEISATEKSPDSFQGLLGIDLMRKVGAVLDFGKSEVYLRGKHSTGEATADELAADYRTWNSRQGTSLRARSVRQPKDGKVSLEAADGSIKEVPLELLSEKDLEYLILREEHAEFESAARKSTKQVDLFDFFDRESIRWDEIKVSMNRNIPEVDVLVDGRTLKFFVDTGAQTTKLSIEAAQLLGKDINSLQVVGESAGLEGRFLPVFAADFGSFQVGETIFHDFRIRVYDFKNMTENRFSGTPHDGVIGTDLLIQLGAVYHTLENRVRVPLH